MTGNIATRLLTAWYYAVLYFAAISQQPLPREKRHPCQRLTVSAMLATSRPAHTAPSTDVKQQKKRLSCQAMQHNNKNENISICSWRGLLQMPQFGFFFGPNDACCLTVTGDSATWLHPLPALTSAAYLDAPRSTHAHLRFAGSACAGPHRDATVSHPHNTDAHSATAAPSQGGSLLLESPPHHEP